MESRIWNRQSRFLDVQRWGKYLQSRAGKLKRTMSRDWRMRDVRIYDVMLQHGSTPEQAACYRSGILTFLIQLDFDFVTGF